MEFIPDSVNFDFETVSWIGAIGFLLGGDFSPSD